MKRAIFLMTVVIVVFGGCKDIKLEPLTNNMDKPPQVSNVVVHSEPGGATITYLLPDDPNLLYVVAEFSNDRTGGTRVVKSSVFKNSIQLDGFMSTDEQEVNLYTVSRAEVRSDPVSVKVKPLMSPIETAFSTLQVRQDFGGVNIQFDNAAGTEFIVHILLKDDEGQWFLHDRLYTIAKAPNYTSRNLEAVEQEFGFYLQDKWQNFSDTLFSVITPLYEEELNKSLWKHYELDNDLYTQLYPERPLSNLWSKTNANWMSQPGGVLPFWITIDLGQTAVLGRMRVNAISASTSNYQWFYSSGTPKVFEVWGSNNPTLDGDWDSWTLLGTFESIKPSGLPIGHNAPEDIEAGLAGENYNFSDYENPYRYVRFKVLQTWGSRTDVMLQELTFWGEPKN